MPPFPRRPLPIFATVAFSASVALALLSTTIAFSAPALTLYPSCEGALGTLFSGSYAAARKQVSETLGGLSTELQAAAPAAKEELLRSRLRELVPLVSRMLPTASDVSPETQCRAAGALHGAQYSLAEDKRKDAKLCETAGARFGVNGATLLCTLQRGRPEVLEAVHPQQGWGIDVCATSFVTECSNAFKTKFAKDCGEETLGKDAARLEAHAAAFCSALK